MSLTIRCSERELAGFLIKQKLNTYKQTKNVVLSQKYFTKKTTTLYLYLLFICMLSYVPLLEKTKQNKTKQQIDKHLYISNSLEKLLFHQNAGVWRVGFVQFESKIEPNFHLFVCFLLDCKKLPFCLVFVLFLFDMLK